MEVTEKPGEIMARRRLRSRPDATELEPIVRLWILRILVTLPARRSFVSSHGFADDTKDVLERLPTQPNRRIDELLPHRWKPGATG